MSDVFIVGALMLYFAVCVKGDEKVKKTNGLIRVISALLLAPLVYDGTTLAQYACENDLIEVMFEQESRVRMRAGTPVDLERTAVDGVDAVLQRLDWCEWQRACDVPEERLDEIQALGQSNTGRPIYNLNNIYRLRIPSGEDVWALSAQLEALAGIILARPVPKPAPPPTPPDYVSSQGYLRPASATPTGIDADYAWTRLGGTGAGVTVCDLEYSWNYNHADVTKAVGSQINTNIADPFDDDNHGTAVIGELVGDNNGWGVTGVCYDADLLTCGTYYSLPPVWNVPGAMAIAISHLSAGDVILLEQQWDYTGGEDYIPIEWWLDYSPNAQSFNGVYAAIQNAVALGIHVIEAGGNGNFDTDLLTWYGMSGGVIVGAGGAYPGGVWPAGDLERLSFSSYGTHYAVQGWGEDVVTTGYGDLYNAEGTNYLFTSSFAGTSSASPIVAGAVACCVGYWTAQGNSPAGLGPNVVRLGLILTGTRQVMPPSGLIGPRPDLDSVFVLFTTCDCTNFCDLNGDFSINPIDVVYMCRYVYNMQDARVTWPGCPGNNGDWNCDGLVNPIDVVWYANFVYKNLGTGPCDPCNCSPYPTCPPYP